MSEKLLTLRELSEYLRAPEDQLARLVDEKIIPAYRIGGELLRFRKEQIDAMRSELDVRIKDKATGKPISLTKNPSKKEGYHRENNLLDSVLDFFYFNDFYILSAAIAGILLAVIFME